MVPPSSNAKPSSPPPPAVAMSVGPKASPTAKPQVADGQAALLALLKVEADARDAASERDLVLIMANETRKLTRARQIFVIMPGVTQKLEVRGVSSLPVVDRNAPLMVVIEDLVREAATRGQLAGAQILPLPSAGSGGASDSYPFRALAWLPLTHASTDLLGGLLLAREEPWSDQDLVIATRLARAYAHALKALRGSHAGVLRRVPRPSKAYALGLAALLLAGAFLPVPMSALAPVELIARDPVVVAAPIDGVVESIAIEPNQAVKKGDLLVKLADTTLRNRFEVAQREVQVAEARLKQSNQVAFTDPRGMHDIAIARAELTLKMAERDFAADLLAKTEIRALQDGLALFSDKRDLVGRPVAVGERLLEVADPARLEARIELPVSDAVTLMQGARAKLFLDSDPLHPWHATVRRADYKAKVGENDVVSFRVVADLANADGRAVPRLGVRGTAQVSGADVPLGFYLFRRPITALRQWLGL